MMGKKDIGSIALFLAVICFLINFFSDRFLDALPYLSLVILFFLGFLAGLFSLLLPRPIIVTLRAGCLKISLLIISLLFALFLFEFFLHVARPAKLQLNFNIKGDLTDYASRGFLKKDRFNKGTDVVRIVGLGDSYAVMGLANKKNYHNVLQERLARIYGEGKIEVLSAGTPSMGPGYYTHILKSYGDLFNPDLVLVGLFEGNDFAPGDIHFKKRRIGHFISESLNPLDRLRGYFHFTSLWIVQYFRGVRIHQRHERAKQKELKENPGLGDGTYTKKEYYYLASQRGLQFHKDKLASFKKQWHSSDGAKTIKTMKAWCDDRGIPMVIAIFPCEFQVDEAVRAEAIQKLGLQEECFDVSGINRVVADFCEEQGIYCIDLLKQFQVQSKSQRLYLLRNDHWNDAGNELAGTIIADYLIDKRLLFPAGESPILSSR
ncbi:MAG: hypothetical protein KBA46_03915 [Candidatus Omnitrophica bacterium]|nr:hypothetical protein [Candidatus Omnitrophota bacterium]